jgi:ribosomal protein S27E
MEQLLRKGSDAMIYIDEVGLARKAQEQGCLYPGEVALFFDIRCPHCGKSQPVAATGHWGGPCVGCGKPTGKCFRWGGEE